MYAKIGVWGPKILKNLMGKKSVAFQKKKRLCKEKATSPQMGITWGKGRRREYAKEIRSSDAKKTNRGD